MKHFLKYPSTFPVHTIISLILVGCIGITSSCAQKDPIEQVETAIYAARGFLGTPYGKNGLDCSRLMQICYKEAGIKLGRSSRDQILQGQSINMRDIQRGDLVFFKLNGKTVGHVGMIVSYPGEPARFIHVSSSKGVTENLLTDSYWAQRYAGARRMVKATRTSLPVSNSLRDYK